MGPRPFSHGRVGWCQEAWQQAGGQDGSVHGCMCARPAPPRAKHSLQPRSSLRSPLRGGPATDQAAHIHRALPFAPQRDPGRKGGPCCIGTEAPGVVCSWLLPPMTRNAPPVPTQSSRCGPPSYQVPGWGASLPPLSWPVPILRHRWGSQGPGFTLWVESASLRASG